MAIPITTGSGSASVAGETVNGITYQQIEVYGGGGASVLTINPDGSLKASIIGTVTINPTSVSGTVGASVIGTVPVTQGGAFVISGSVLTLQAPVSSLVSGVTNVITTTASVLVLSAPPAGQRNYITQILVTNQQTSVTGAGTQVNIVDNGTTIYAGYAAAGGGGFSISFPTPLRQPTSSLGLFAATTSQASVIVAASGYTGT